ncbi:hypothetical protein HY045_00035 [Candidatus Woesebacteria bacterium]|nr:hypothetical protein [Candidatus Woesebacteria bacterium]
MHAFLVVGDLESQVKEIDRLGQSLDCKLLEFKIEKIEDVRDLNKFISLKISEPTGVIVKNIQEVTPEGLNAFLKNLEEPQEDLYFILTTNNLHKVLPTIVSRCQVINLSSKDEITVNKSIESFLEMKTGGKLAQIDKIKERDEAKRFIDDIILFLHHKLLENNTDHQKIMLTLEAAQKARTGLLRNGNVGLQLTNFVVNLDA